MVYVLKMDGMKVRTFNTWDDAYEWGINHCKYASWSITQLNECRGLPRACKPIHPNLDMPELRYKPFVSLG